MSLLLVGTYTETLGHVKEGKGKGIHLVAYDRRSEHPLKQIKILDTKFVGNNSPTWITPIPHSDCFLSITETEDSEGTLSSFSLKRGKTETTINESLISQIGTGGKSTCHVVTDSLGRLAFLSNYSQSVGGSVSVFSLDSTAGKIIARTDVVAFKGSSVNSDRQLCAHPHQVVITSDDQFILVPDLGEDRIHQFRIDYTTGKLIENGAFTVSKKGSGPRHLVIHPTKDVAYILNELANTITICTLNRSLGQITSEIGTVSTLPPDFSGTSHCAEILINKSGSTLYASNRGHNSIAVFHVGPLGEELNLVECHSTNGAVPRAFVFGSQLEDTLIVANQDSHNLVIFPLNLESGRIMESVAQVEVGAPVAVVVVENFF